MKKFFLYFYMVLVAFSLVSCNQSTSTENIVINVGKSDKFTEEEINQAIDYVKDKFNFPACTLTKIWYDEEISNSYIERYLSHGKDAVNGVNLENVIVLLSDFEVDNSGDNPVLTPNSTYTDYNWILIRDSKTSNWKIDDWGY